VGTAAEGGRVNVLTIAWRWLDQPGNWQGTDGITARLLEHLSYSALGLLLAALIALPLGALIGHTGRGAFLAVNLANAARALPTLGLVILVVLFAVPPILVNTYAGIGMVDAELTGAASGMGMTSWQVLLRVEVPSALPLILLGLRTAAIQIVSTATISAYVGLGGLGRFIFDGLARRDYDSVTGGAVLVALLAVLAEAVFVLARRLLVAPGVRQPRSS
jgi:osmoprotectant transport system permease protein